MLPLHITEDKTNSDWKSKKGRSSSLQRDFSSQRPGPLKPQALYIAPAFYPRLYYVPLMSCKKFANFRAFCVLPIRILQNRSAVYNRSRDHGREPMEGRQDTLGAGRVYSVVGILVVEHNTQTHTPPQANII